MKNILNRLIQHEVLSRQESKDILVGIANKAYNESEIASFLTVYMMRSIQLEELEGFRDALLELCLAVDLSAYEPIDLCGTGGDGKDGYASKAREVWRARQEPRCRDVFSSGQGERGGGG